MKILAILILILLAALAFWGCVRRADRAIAEFFDGLSDDQ